MASVMGLSGSSLAFRLIVSSNSGIDRSSFFMDQYSNASSCWAVRVVGAQPGGACREQLLEQGLGQAVLTLPMVQPGQVTLADEGIGVAGAQLGGAGRQHLLQQRLGQVVLPLVPIQRG